MLPRPVGRQHYVAYWPADGHQVVFGTAGSGKTVMAIHRAAHLARSTTANHGPVLLVTFTKSLVTYIKHLAAGETDPIVVETYGKFARGYLASRGRMSRSGIADPQDRLEFLKSAIEIARVGYQSNGFFERPDDFFLGELAWIDGQGITSLEQYLGVDRVGRTAPLQPPSRIALWKVREAYRQNLVAGGKQYDWWSLANEVRAALLEDPQPRRYRHIVVDEAQDLSPQEIRSLVDALQAGGSVTLFADYAQQIYGNRISWRSVGLNIKRRESFTENYRNTAEIAALALCMADMAHFQDSTDIVAPTAPSAAGAKPTLVRCRSRSEEAAVVRSQASQSGRVARVGVLARTRAEAEFATHGISGVRRLHEDMTSWDAGPGVYAGTYHSGKGLEFDVVILPFCGNDRIPDSGIVRAFGLADALARESRLLYVGVTRAKTELLVTYAGELTSVLPNVSSGLWTVGQV